MARGRGVRVRPSGERLRVLRRPRRDARLRPEGARAARSRLCSRGSSQAGASWPPPRRLLVPVHVFPKYLYWRPISLPVGLALGVIVLGAAWFLRKVGMIPMTLSFLVTFAGLIAALAGRSFIAIWHPDTISGASYWLHICTSPELFIFVFFMIFPTPRPRPKARPDGSSTAPPPPSWPPCSSPSNRPSSGSSSRSCRA